MDSDKQEKDEEKDKEKHVERIVINALKLGWTVQFNAVNKRISFTKNKNSITADYNSPNFLSETFSEWLR